MIRINRLGVTTLTVATGLALVGAVATPAAAAAKPAVTAVSATAGPTAGGSTVTIHGTGFSHVKWVHFGSAAGLSIHVVSTTKLTVVAPAHAAGKVSLHVHTAAGTSATHPADNYTYDESPSSYTAGTVRVPHGTPAGVSCVSATFCIVVDQRGSAVTWNGTAGSAPVSVTGGGALRGVSCTSITFCMAVGDKGAAYRFDGTHWSKVDVVNNPGLTSVSCLSASFCVAVDDAGNAYQYDGTQWTATPIDTGHALSAVSCPTEDFCVAVDGSGHEVSFGGTSWAAPVDIDAAFALASISCPATGFCVAFDSQGDALKLAAGTWSATAVSHDPMAVSCASSSECLAVGFDAGTAYELTSGGWAQITEPSERYTGQSCVKNVRQCVAVSEQGDLIVTTDASPAPVSIDLAASEFALSCPSSTHCITVNDLGEAFMSSDGVWSPLPSVTPLSLFDFTSPVISCVSATWCMADGVTFLEQSEESAIQFFDGHSWTDAPGGEDAPPIQSVSCLSTTFCMAIDDSGDALLWDGASWSAPGSIDASGLTDLSCASPSLCVAIDSAGRVLTFTGQSWSNPAWVDGSRSIDAVSCAGHTCHVADSRSGTLSFDGTTWTRTAQLADPVVALSCLPTNFCYALSDSPTQGSVVVGVLGSWSSTPVPVAAGARTTMLSCVAGPTCEIVDPDGYAFRGTR